MPQTPDQLTKLPICPGCRKEELTNEELARASDPGARRCWFCVAKGLISMGMEGNVPDPAEFGRPYISKEEGINYTKGTLFRTSMPDVAAAIAQAAEGTPPPIGTAPGQSIPTPPPQKPLLQFTGPTPIKFDETQRTEFAARFGIDPVPKSQPHEIVVHGANEDTYMKFVCPIQVDLAEERELKRIMGGMLEIFGKLLKYGPNFAATLIELQAMTPEMFLGGRGK